MRCDEIRSIHTGVKPFHFDHSDHVAKTMLSGNTTTYVEKGRFLGDLVAGIYQNAAQLSFVLFSRLWRKPDPVADRPASRNFVCGPPRLWPSPLEVDALCSEILAVEPHPELVTDEEEALGHTVVKT